MTPSVQVNSRRALSSVKESIAEIHKAVESIGSPSIKPIPVRLEELARSVSIDLDGGSGATLPMRLHGAGSRSLASLQVQGVLYDRRIGLDGPSPRAHPLSLIEEPEAHLHPQAQLELPGLLGQISGQIVVSTHSSHLASVASHESIRLIRSGTEPITFKPLEQSSAGSLSDPELFYLDDMEKLRRLVERPFGEILFASAVVLADGACERAMLPPLLREGLGDRSNGVCVVDCESLTNSRTVGAIVKFCRLAELEWLIYADSDDEGRKAMQRLPGSPEAEGRIVWNHQNENGLGDGGNIQGIATEKLLIDFDQEMCQDIAVKFGYEDGGSQDLLSFLKPKKGILGSHFARALIDRYQWRGMEPGEWVWPNPIHRLISRLDQILPGKVHSSEANKSQ